MNAKRANRKANKAQRKNYKKCFNLLKFSVKENASRGKRRCGMFLDEFCITDGDVNLVVEYFKSKGYTVEIVGTPSYNGLREKIVISW